MNLRREATKGVAWTAIGNWGDELARLLVFAILSRVLLPEDFGLVALAAVFTTFTRIVAEGGLGDAIVQHPDLNDEHLDTAFWANVTFASLLAAGIAAVAPFAADLVKQPELGPVLAVLSISIFISGLGSVQRAVLTRKLAFGSLTTRKIAAVIVSGAVGVAAALGGWGVWSLVAQRLVAATVSVVTLWTISVWRPRLRFSFQHLREMLGFGANTVGFKVLNFFRRRSDDLLIGSILGAAALGFYTVAYRLLRLMINITTSIVGSVAFPVLSRIQDEPKRVRSAYYKAVRYTSLLAFPGFLGIAVLAPEVTLLLFGSQWDASVPVMRVLALGGLLQSVMFINGVVLKALGKPSWRLLITGIEAVVLVMAFFFAARWGILAVAVAFVVVSYALAPLSFLAAHRLIGLSPRILLKQISTPLIASLVTIAVVVGAKALVADLRLVWEVIALVAVGFLVYGGSLLLINRPLTVEVSELVRSLRSTPRNQGSSPDW